MSQNIEFYKEGDRVECLFGHPMWKNPGAELIDISPDLVGLKGTIEYSYVTKYGGTGLDNYRVLWENGVSIAWYSLGQLKRI